MFLRQEGSSKNDHNHNKDLGYKLGTKNFATGPSGRGKTASRPSPPFLPPISREPNDFTEQLNHTEPPTQAVSPSLVAPATTRPDLSLTSIYDGPDRQLDNKSELQEPTPKEEPGQYALWDQLAADLQTGTSFESSNSFDGRDPGDGTGIRSLGDGNCLPPPEPTSPQARVDLYAATAGKNTDRANSYDGPDSQLDRKSELQEPPPKDKTDRTNTKPGIKSSCKDLATGLFRQGRTNSEPGLSPLPLQAEDNPQPGHKLTRSSSSRMPPSYTKPARRVAIN
jgi:hypothetical protein